MRSAAQVEASKKNGAKSKGPVTTEGRARSSQNAVRHGLTSHKSVIIDGESKEEWEQFQHEFLVKFQPRDFVEERIVIEMAVCRWRLERIWKMQVSILDQGIADEFPVIEEQYDQADMALVQANAHVSRKLDLQSLDQLETRITRRFDRALRNYNEIRAQFPSQHESESKLQNEPNIDSEATNSARQSQGEIAKSENEPNSRIHAINLPRISEPQTNDSNQQHTAQNESSPT